MPFDTRELPATRSANRDLAIWLFAICFMILVMVVLGGVTRLTGSGLSIMEWAPVSGVLPPLSHADWEHLFALYKQIPQYQILHPGMGLRGFQGLFWMEWIHRLWGRLLGVAFVVPLVWFWLRGRLPRSLRPRLILFFILGGLQGAVGWFMVSSGFFPDSTAVAPLRLAVHLALALVLYAAIFWTALSLHSRGRVISAPLLRPALTLLLGLLSITIVAGSIVAGTHAGFLDNTFPLMEGRLVPPGYAVHNLLTNLAAVQFNHRALATLTALTGAVIVARFWRGSDGRANRAILALGFFLLLQYLLGVATLLLVVPTELAALHQANAVLLLSAALLCLHQTAPALRTGMNPASHSLPVESS